VDVPAEYTGRQGDSIGCEESLIDHRCERGF
jgi:hypothetical protein